MKNKLAKSRGKHCLSENGITLIALVLTIIILLILAGVSLNLVAGSNGILSQATSAVNATKQAQLEEELQLSLAEIMMDYYIEGNGKSLQEYIIEQCNKTENNGMLEVGNGMFSSIDGDLYYTDSNGNISMIAVDNNGNVSIEESVSADGTVNDTNPPSIFATATTNSISLVLKDPLSGIAGWAYSAINAEPTMWNEVSDKPKSHSETITGLTNGTTYYIWAKDANGNKSQVKEVRTRDFDELSYDVTWEGAMATITVKKPTTGVQYLNTEGNWVDYTTPVTVESGTTVQFKVTDGNNTKTFETVKPLKKSTITYDANGGIGNVPSAQTAEHTNNVAVDFSTKPSKSGSRFIGWSQTQPTNINPDETEFMENGTTTFAMPNHDVTLYAVYQNATPVYGTSILENYSDIYTNLSNRTSVKNQNWKYVAGNTTNVCSTVRANQDSYSGKAIHSNPYGKVSNGELAVVQAGSNEFELKENTKGKWVMLRFQAGSTDNCSIEGLKLKFSDNSIFTAEGAVSADYLEPLVLYESGTNIRNENNCWTPASALITGGQTNSTYATWSFLLFKVRSIADVSGITFNSSVAFQADYDGIEIIKFDNLELSTEPF